MKSGLTGEALNFLVFSAASTAANKGQAPKFVGGAPASKSGLPLEILSLKEKERLRRERQRKLLVRGWRLVVAAAALPLALLLLLLLLHYCCGCRA